MSHDDVDFTVTSSDDGADEDLPQSERRLWSPGQRAVTGVVALGAVIGIGIGIASSQHSPRAKPVAQPARSTSTRPDGGPARITLVPSPAGTAFVVRPGVITVDANKGAIACPQAGDGQSACESTHSVPPGVLAALRAHFPDARVVAETNQTLRDTGFGSNGLWYRRVVAMAGTIRITVMIRRPLPEDLSTGDTRIGRNRTVLTESTASGGFTVTATVDSPRSHPSLSGSLDLLISDTRLLVLR